MRTLDPIFFAFSSPDSTIANRYGARNLPMTVLIDPQGRVDGAAQGARDWASREAFAAIDERLR